MPVRYVCKYLGFQVGPGKGDSSWHAPFKKYQERINMWKDQPLGLFWDARVYNTFALPTLTYVAQLETPPSWVLDGVIQSLESAAKGPRVWASAIDLWTLKEAFGLHASFKNLEWTAGAAKVRVVGFDKACLPSSIFRKDVCKLESFIRCPGDNCTIHRWHGWYDKAFSRVLAQTHDAIRDQAGSIEAIRVHRSATSVELMDNKLWRK